MFKLTYGCGQAFQDRYSLTGVVLRYKNSRRLEPAPLAQGNDIQLRLRTDALETAVIIIIKQFVNSELDKIPYLGPFNVALDEITLAQPPGPDPAHPAGCIKFNVKLDVNITVIPRAVNPAVKSYTLVVTVSFSSPNNSGVQLVVEISDENRVWTTKRCKII